MKPRYHSDELRNAPKKDLVLVQSASTNRSSLIAIDGKEFKPIETFWGIFVSPGKHKYTFKISAVTSKFCSGPLKGETPKKNISYPTFRMYNGKIEIFSQRSHYYTDNYTIDVSAKAGQAIKFKYSSPDCNSKYSDIYTSEIRDSFDCKEWVYATPCE